MTEHAPLRGARVTSLATNVPGPVAAARLSALGAEVLKVEPPGGDLLSRAAPSWYDALVRGQTVVALDLKSPQDRTVLREALASSDVLLLSSRPSALARLGVSRHAIEADFPRLCTVSIVGSPSPESEVPGHDLTYQASAGLVASDSLPRSLFADLAAAAEAVSEALALLLGRAASGVGGWREVSLVRCAEQLAAPIRHGLTAPGGALGGGNPAYALYEASDGTIAVAALEPHFAERLLAVLQLPEPDAGAMARRFRERTTDHWEAVARAHDLPIVALSAPSAAS